MDFLMSKLSIIACISTTISGQSYRTIGDVEIDDALQRTMLDIHNELRSELALNGLPDSGLYQPLYDVSQPTATYMHALNFDPALAALAQNYLNQQTSCYIMDSSFGHNDNRGSEFITTYGQYASFEYDSSASTIGIGENILQYPIDSSMASYDQAAVNAEAGWWDEYQHYLYDDNRCFSEPCGHYTQMAWADTRYVGCGSIECGGNLIALCNYYPAGNVGTNKPYTEGTPCSECATKASDRDQCDGSSGGLCSGCQSPWIGRCTDVASNCASDLAAYCPTQTKSGVAKTCGDIGLDGNYDDFWNGHLCGACTETCGTCTAEQLTAASCTNDGLDYQFTDHAAFTFDEDDDPQVITQSANWAIAGMCMIFGICCIVLGIGYYLHFKKVDQLEIRLRATKLINNDESKKEDNLRARAMSETIDGDHRATIDVNVDVDVDVDEHGETIEIEASIEKTNE